MKNSDVQKIIEIGISLSEEKDPNRLLERILDDAMQITGCDAGTLYLKEGEQLRFKIMRNCTMNVYEGGDGREVHLPPVPLRKENVCAYAVIANETVCIENVRACEKYDFSGPIRYDAMTGYHTQSMVVVPMKNRKGVCIGVLQLINAKNAAGEVCAFRTDLIRAVESVACQAAVSIENIQYIKEIRDLFHSFVRVMSTAIDERSPYNASHTRHMVEYGDRFLDYLNEQDVKAGREKSFDKNHRDELLMSVWLHDIGKLVIPLEIMDKAARLTEHQEIEIRHRFEIMKLKNRIQQLEGRKSLQEAEEDDRKLDELLAFIKEANRAGFLPDDKLERVAEAGKIRYQDENGAECCLLTADEVHSLSVRKGTLTEEERKIMESHVVMTRKFLEQIHFSDDYSHVTDWASAHHEYLNGSGYPNGTTAENIPKEVRILTILDIFDALVAEDRPYKKGMPVEKALSILNIMAEKEGKLDPELVRLFTESRSWIVPSEKQEK